MKRATLAELRAELKLAEAEDDRLLAEMRTFDPEKHARWFAVREKVGKLISKIGRLEKR